MPSLVATAEVGMWQALLSRVDLTVPVTGVWCPLTGQATAEWQRAAGVEATGQMDDATWAAAGRALAWVAEEAPAHRRQIQLGDTGRDVRYAQRRLVARGYRVAIDGAFGPGMRRAVESFREAAGIQPGPGVDDAVWAALG